MSVELTACNFNISGTASLNEDLSLYSPDGTVQIGSSGFGAITLALENGTGDNQANQMYAARVTVPSGGALGFDLCDGSMENFRGQPISFSKIKLVILSLVTPGSGRHVVVGPQGVADAAQLWFAGAGTDAGTQVFESEIKSNLLEGWDVSTSGDSVFVLSAPAGTEDVEIDLVIIGVQF